MAKEEQEQAREKDRLRKKWDANGVVHVHQGYPKTGRLSWLDPSSFAGRPLAAAVAVTTGIQPIPAERAGCELAGKLARWRAKLADRERSSIAVSPVWLLCERPSFHRPLKAAFHSILRFI